MKHRSFVLAALLTAAWPGRALAAGTEEPKPPAAAAAPDVSKELLYAKAAIEQNQYAPAIDLMRRAERKDPNNANVQNLLGFSLRKSGQLDLAFKHYKRALELDPKHRGAHEYIGEAYLMNKEPEKAREHLAKLKGICGESCEEYRDLAKSIAQYKP
jgi:Flp pilus assembly protein TadD